LPTNSQNDIQEGHDHPVYVYRCIVILEWYFSGQIFLVKTVERSFPKRTIDLNPDVPAKYNHPLILFINGFLSVEVFTYSGCSVDFVGSVGSVGSTVDPVSSVMVGGGVAVVQFSHLSSPPIDLKQKGNRDISLIYFNSRFESNHIS
jgi:hypothetical protein